MDPFFSLILLCIAMLLASFLAGNIPLSFHLSESRLKMISNFGVGLLVGTSLVVIIPEGVETLYSVQKVNSLLPTASGSAFHQYADENSLSLMEGGQAKKRQSGAASIPSLSRRQHQQSPEGVVSNQLQAGSGTDSSSSRPLMVALEDSSNHPILQARSALEKLQASSSSTSPQGQGFGDHLALTRRALPVDGLDGPLDGPPVLDTGLEDGGSQDPNQGANGPEPILGGSDNPPPPPPTPLEPGTGAGGEEGDGEAHKYIGLALISGFILMFLIDQMGPTHAHGSGSGHGNHVSVADFTELHNLQLDDTNIRMPSALGMTNAVNRSKRNNPITIGLVVHAAADGIALGASASRPELRFIVFLAIMLHKAPAAFGLSSVLLQHGYNRRQTRQQVAIFSLAAPIGALLTFIFIQLSGQREAASLHWWTGMLLLFSGGTFLYVAMHVMSELNNNKDHHSHSGNGNGNGYGVGGAYSEDGLRLGEVLSVIAGMIVPLLLSVDHEH